MPDLLKWARDRRNQVSQLIQHAPQPVKTIAREVATPVVRTFAPAIPAHVASQAAQHPQQVVQVAKPVINFANQTAQAAVTTGSKVQNTTQAARLGVVGLANVGAQSVFGSDESYRNAIIETNRLMNTRLSRGAGGYISPEMAATAGGGFHGLKTNFINPTLAATADVAPWVTPTGIYSKGATLTAKLATEAGMNAAVSGGSDAALQYAQNGRVDPRELFQNTVIGGVTGMVNPLMPGAREHVGQFVEAHPQAVNTAAVVAGNIASPGSMPMVPGTIAGKKAPGFAEAQAVKKTWTGKDGKARFEVDDSQARVRTTEEADKLAKVRSTTKTPELTKAEEKWKNAQGFDNQLKAEAAYQDVRRATGYGMDGHRLADVLDHPKLFKQYPHLKDIPVGEDRSLNPGDASTELGLDDKIRIFRTPQTTPENLLHEVQHAVQHHEDFAKGGDVPDAIDPKQVQTDRPEILPMQERLRQINEMQSSDQYNQLTPDGRRELMQERYELEDKINHIFGQERWKQYYNQHGEVEARAVAERAKLTQKERDAKSVTETMHQDVPTDQQIVSHEKGDNHTSKLVGGQKAPDYAKAKAKGETFTGPDGQHRFEIDDSKAKIKDVKAAQKARGFAEHKKAVAEARKAWLDATRSGNHDAVYTARSKYRQLVADAPKLTVGDILDHPTLYKNYPRVKDLPVEVMNKRQMGNASAAVASNRSGTHIEMHITPSVTKSDVLHETQHILQVIEDFARGGSTSEFRERPMTPEIRNARFKKFVILKSIEQHLRDKHDFKDVIPSSSATEFRNGEGAAALRRAKAAKDPYILQKLTELNDVNKELKNHPTRYDQYLRRNGEAESRAVEHRMDMTPAERKKTPFYDSYDVPVDEVTNKMQDGRTIPTQDPRYHGQPATKPTPKPVVKPVAEKPVVLDKPKPPVAQPIKKPVTPKPTPTAPPLPPKPPVATPTPKPEPQPEPPKKPADQGLDEITYSKGDKKRFAREDLGKMLARVRTDVFNRFAPIDNLVKGRGLKASQDPSVLLKRYSGGMGIANHKIDAELQPILRQTKDFHGLRQFLIAERSNELARRGIAKTANKALAELKAKVGDAEYANFQKIATQLYDYQRKMLDELHSLGGLSDDAHVAITKTNEKYIPFNRVLDAHEQSGFIAKAYDINSKNNGIKRIKGSERDIIDPIESIIKNTYDMTRTIEKQRVMKSLVELGDFKKIKPTMVPVRNVEHRAEVNAEFIKKIGDWAKSLGMKDYKTEGQIRKKKGGARLAFYRPGDKTVTRHFGTSAKTFTHEVGHFLDHKYGLKSRFYATGSTKEIGQEMSKHMQSIGQNKTRTGSPEERFAHAFEYWMFHRNEAKKFLPKFSAQMEQVIKDIPDLKPLKTMTIGNRSGFETMDELIFAPSQFEPKEPHITVLQDGKPVHYETSPEIARAINGLDEEQLGPTIKVMSMPSRLVRATATGLNIGFAVPNVIRDQMSAAINSKYKGIPMYDYVSGLASAIKKDDVYKKWIESGADQASFFSQDRKTLQRSVRDVTGEQKLRNVTGKYVRNPLELFRIVGEYSEKGTRIGTYKRALKGAAKEGMSPEDAALAAMVQSREASVDFAKHGSQMRAINSLVPFLNARLQGSAKFVQSAKDRPAQTAAMGMALAGIPAALLYAHNSQDENYKEIPDYIKDNNFIIMTGNKDVPFIKVPKGEVGQIFANPIESFLDFATHQEGADAQHLAAGIVKALSPISSYGDAIPPLFKVPLEVATNYDTFRGKNIVSPFKKDLPPELQDAKDTSKTFEKVGQVFKVSPAKAEHAFQGLTAGVGKQATQVTDSLFFHNRPKTADMPVADRFLGEPKDLSKSANDIYAQLDKAKNERARENYDIKNKLKNGDTSALDGVSKQRASGLKKSVRDDQAMETLTPTQKALYNATAEQLDDMAQDPKYKADVEKIKALKFNASKSSSSTAKTYDDQKEVDAFSASNQKTTTIGDTFYYKDRNGTVQNRPQYKQDYNVASTQADLAMDRAKGANSIDKYYTAAKDKYDALKVYIDNLDPEIDTAEIATKTKELENLRDTVAKYKSYGNSFTKGKSTSSGGTGSGTTRTIKGKKVWVAPKGGKNSLTLMKDATDIRTILKNAKVTYRKV
jgi:hypothetical protein